MPNLSDKVTSQENTPLKAATAADRGFPVVGIGLSAGGLDALKKIFQELPAQPQLAIVVIQHLLINHRGLTDKILSHLTTMPIHVVEKMTKIARNEVYIISKDTDLIIENGFLKPIPRAHASRLHLPIDTFFHSLAQDQLDSAVGVILSGNGSDGSLGLKSISTNGGTTIVQDPKSAKNESMPRMALKELAPDFLLAPDKIGQVLKKMGEDTEHQLTTPSLKAEKPFSFILGLLRHKHGVNFTEYKLSTLNRRIKRRMLFSKIKSLKEYGLFLEQNEDELLWLYQDLAINVTQFFRDPEMFEILKQQVFPEMINGQEQELSVRIWVPGCSSGEEAYSLAIGICEVMDQISSHVQVQIFATDISEGALNKARAGVYIEKAVSGLSAERLTRFFTKIDRGYQVCKRIRDMCLFAKHDMTQDPPFSRMNLVSCRNVLIYLNPALQKKVIDIFSYVLKPGGHLLLGKSETIANSQGLFHVVNKKYKLHQKSSVKGKLPVYGPSLKMGPGKNHVTHSLLDVRLPHDLKTEMDGIYFQLFGHSGLIINERLEVLHIYGDVSTLVKHTQGEATLNLTKMVHKDLLLEIRSAVFTAKKTKKLVKRNEVVLAHGRKKDLLNLDVVPFLRPKQEGLYAVFFTDLAAAQVPSKAKKLSQKEASRPNLNQIKVLQSELTSTKAHLQSIIEEQDLSNEELQTVNEEIMSSNEELQSSNEELETAQEELQSSNEELRTLNEELHFRNLELDVLNGDLGNILISITVPILIISNDLRIRRFTPAAQKIFNLINGDIGRPFSNVKHNLKVADLQKQIERTIYETAPQELEVQDEGEHWYALRIRPYKTPDNRIDGAVIVLSDIHETKLASEKIKRERNIAQSILETMDKPFLVLDENFHVRIANQQFYKIFQVSADEVLDKLIFNLSDGQWDFPELHTLVENILPQQNQMKDIEVTHEFKRIGERTLKIHGHQISYQGQSTENRSIPIVLLSFDDLTEQKMLFALETQARKMAEKDCALLGEEREIRAQFVSTLSHDLRTPLTAAKLASQLIAMQAKDSPAVLKSCSRIVTNIDRIDRMLTDLLNVGLLQAGHKLPLDIRECDFCEVIIISLEILGMIHGHRFFFSHRPPVIGFWDPRALQRLIENVANNAAKYGTPNTNIKFILEDKDTQVELAIHNEGEPIPPKEQQALFNLFHRGKSATQSNKKGWGIGLTLVKGVMDAHGGEIQVESAIGIGTTFKFIIPKDCR